MSWDLYYAARLTIRVIQSTQTDPVTLALTGQLPFLLLLTAILTWPIAVGLLALYRRSVRRSMRSRAPAADRDAPIPPGLRSETLDEGVHTLAIADLTTQPWRVAGVYVAAGMAYALVTTCAFLISSGIEFLPIRFLILLTVYAWPVVLTIAIVAASVRTWKVAIAASYFGVVFFLGGLVIASSPDVTWWQVALVWGTSNLPATALLLPSLARRVRAVGPHVLTFMFVALTGSNVVLAFAGASDSRLRFVIDVADVVGLGAVGSMVTLIAIGFVLFALFGWLALKWIRARYEAKLTSDESVTLDAVWVLFAVTHSIGFVFAHPLWGLAAVAAFAAYKTVAHAGFRWLRRAGVVSDRGPRLLLLRSFSIGKDAERLFDALEKHWRRVGSIQMIAGIDLAARSVEPHEFLEFLSGRLARRFIDGPREFSERLAVLDTRPDRDLRFRVNDFFCYDDTWKMVFGELARRSDAVLMDLRGFTRQNSGCVFEIRELARLVPLERVVFVVDDRTDRQLLAETLGRDAPGVLHLKSLRWSELRRLLQSLAAAVQGAPLTATVGAR